MKHKSSAHQPRKRFGQNFLKDENVIRNIIAALNPQPKDRIIEIGPGLGALTKPLLEQVSKLEVIELDRDLAAELKNYAIAQDITQKFIIHQGDALKFDYSQLERNHSEKLRLIGNLPYNISTPLIFHLLNFCPIIQDMFFMLQYELVERIASAPHHKSYGKLSVMLQYYCQATTVFTVEPQAFYPVPKVRSAIVRLVPYNTPPYPAKNVERLREITGAAFNQRRKTLSNSLKNYLTKEDFLSLDIEPGARPEQLTVAEFVRIANWLEDKA
jgi:16S rRNA (adenine1518-N6/adenine1519-N6)-dimethyltransferase